jgi:hypothetical protein
MRITWEDYWDREPDEVESRVEEFSGAATGLAR